MEWRSCSIEDLRRRHGSDPGSSSNDCSARSLSREAVIFDLWDTLVEFPWELAKAHLAEMAGQLPEVLDLL